VIVRVVMVIVHRVIVHRVSAAVLVIVLRVTEIVRVAMVIAHRVSAAALVIDLLVMEIVRDESGAVSELVPLKGSTMLPVIDDHGKVLHEVVKAPQP
jgi:hypothetical protein